MFNDSDRLQQMEDNFNGEDYNVIYNALGLQQKMQRDLAKLTTKSNCKHVRKEFTGKVALCLDCGKDVSKTPLNSVEKEELR